MSQDHDDIFSSVAPDGEPLIPCPFCGWRKPHDIEDLDVSVHWIECPDCFAQGPCEETEQEACDSWNKRKVLP